MSSFFGETENPQSWRVHDGDGIRDWIAADQAQKSCSLSNRLCEECVETFKSILKQLRRIDYLPKVVCRSLERSGASLILWADGHGILQGDLDDVLKKSRFLRKSILELLISISQTLIDRLLPSLIPADRNAIYVGKLVYAIEDARTDIRENYASSDSSEDLEDEDSEENDGKLPSTPSARILNNMTDDIRFDVECLLDLESLIKSPFIDPPKRKSVELEWSYNAPTPHQPYLERISRRFPLAKQDLVDRLAKACWKRFQRIQIDKHRNSGLEERETKDGVSEFYDSGLGTSLGMTTSYAETVMSYRQNSGKSMSTRIPPLPAEAKKGDPFECVACGRSIRIANNSAWKRHLFDDLRPWMCHDASCQYGNEPFSSKEDWAQHLALQHGFQSDWHSLDCPFCLESTGDGKTAILKHLATHFEEISLSSLPPGVDSDSDSGGGVSHATAEVSEKSLQDATGQFDGSIRYISNFELEWRADTDVTPKSGLDQVYHKTEQSPTNSRASSAGDEERERERQKAQERLQRIRERIAKQNDEISRRTAIPFKRTSTGFSPSLADQQREQEHVDAIRRLEIADRQAQEAREARKQEKEDKAQRHQLMERMMPQRQATVRPGSRRHRVLHNDGDERVRVKAKGSHSKATT